MLSNGLSSFELAAELSLNCYRYLASPEIKVLMTWLIPRLFIMYKLGAFIIVIMPKHQRYTFLNI